MDSLNPVTKSELLTAQCQGTSEAQPAMPEEDRPADSRSPVRKPPYLYRPFSSFNVSEKTISVKEANCHDLAETVSSTTDTSQLEHNLGPPVDEACQSSNDKEQKEPGSVVANPVDGYLIEEEPSQDDSQPVIYVVESANDEAVCSRQSVPAEWSDSNDEAEGGVESEELVSDSTVVTQAWDHQETAYDTEEYREELATDAKVGQSESYTNTYTGIVEQAEPDPAAHDTMDTGTKDTVAELTENGDHVDLCSQPLVYTDDQDDIAEEPETDDNNFCSHAPETNGNTEDNVTAQPITDAIAEDTATDLPPTDENDQAGQVDPLTTGEGDIETEGEQPDDDQLADLKDLQIMIKVPLASDADQQQVTEVISDIVTDQQICEEENLHKDVTDQEKGTMYVADQQYADVQGTASEESGKSTDIPLGEDHGMESEASETMCVERVAEEDCQVTREDIGPEETSPVIGDGAVESDVPDSVTDPEMVQGQITDADAVKVSVLEEAIAEGSFDETHIISDKSAEEIGGYDAPTLSSGYRMGSVTQDSTVHTKLSVQEENLSELPATGQEPIDDQKSHTCQLEGRRRGDFIAAAPLASDDGVTEDKSVTSTVTPITESQPQSEQTPTNGSADLDEEIRWIAASVMTDSDQTNSSEGLEFTDDQNDAVMDRAKKPGFINVAKMPAFPLKLAEVVVKVEKLPLDGPCVKIVGSATVIDASRKEDSYKDPKDAPEKRTKADPKTCRHCKKSFSSVTNKRRHMKTVHNSRKETDEQKERCNYSCPKCVLTFSSHDDKLQHMKRAHEKVMEAVRKSATSSRKDALTCAKCNITYATVRNKERHMRSVHKTSVGKSISSFSKNIFLKSKFHQKQMRKPAKTPSADKKQNTGSKLEPSKPSHVCFCCQKPFDIFTNMSRHIRRCHSDNANVQSGNTYQCTQCGKYLASVSSLGKHVKNTCSSGGYMSSPEKSNAERNLHQCKECGKSFKSDFSLKSHMQISHVKPNTVCKKCDKSYASEQNLLRHMETVHRSEKKEAVSPQSASRRSLTSTAVQSSRQTTPNRSSSRRSTTTTSQQLNTSLPTLSRSHPSSSTLSRRPVSLRESPRTNRSGKFCPETTESGGLLELKFGNRKRTRSEPAVPLTKLKRAKKEERSSEETVDESQLSPEERDKLNTCFKCGNTYTTFRNLHRHVTTIHKIKSFPKKLGLIAVKSEKPDSPLSKKKPDRPPSASSSIDHSAYSHEKTLSKKKPDSPPPAPAPAKRLKKSDDASEESVFRCPECRLYYYKQCQLDEHYRRAHGDENMPEQCVLCEKGFFTKESLVHHLKQFHGADRKKTTSSENPKNRNVQSHETEAETSYMCPECDTPYFTEADYETHFLKEHGWGSFPYLCPKCNKRFLLPSKLEDHVQSHNSGSMQTNENPASENLIPDSKNDSTSKSEDDSVIKCTYCGKIYQLPYSCERHIIKEHGRTKLQFPCSKCTKGFCTKARLETHSSFAHHLPAESSEVLESNQEQQTEVVSKAWKQPTNLRKADETPQKSTKELVANQPSPKSASESKQICNFCSKLYTDMKSLEDHIRSTHGNANLPLQCPECSRGFMVSSRLENHCVRIHGCLLAECEVNPKYKAKASQDHQQKEQKPKARSTPQTNTPDYSCSLCSKSYSDTRYLEKHFRGLHGVEKMPHHCPLCDQAYLMSSRLENHCVRIHGSPLSECKQQNKTRHGQENQETPSNIGETQILTNTCGNCPVCSKSFEIVSKLERHVRNVHGEDKLPHHCASCQKGYMTLSSVVKHSQREHGIMIKDSDDKVEMPQSPPAEGRVRRKIVAPKRHLSPVESARHRCEVCDISYETSQGLLNHIRLTHGHETLPHQCGICQKGFLTHNSLRHHSRTHEVSSPPSYECAICQACVQSLEALEQHIIWQHGDEKCLLQCPKCGRGFMTTNNLQRHLSQQECINGSSDGGNSDIEDNSDCEGPEQGSEVEITGVDRRSLLSGQSSFYMECETVSDTEPESHSSRSTKSKDVLNKGKALKSRPSGGSSKKVTSKSAPMDVGQVKKCMSPQEMNDLVLKQLPPLSPAQASSSNLLNQLILACDSVAE